MTIRRARREQADAALIARCVMMGVGHELDSLTDDKRADLVELENLSLRDDTLYSYRNAFVAECDGERVAAMVAYAGCEYRKMRAVSFPRLSFFRGQDVEAMPVETCEGEFYFDTLAVMPQWRGRGIGRALFRHVIDYKREHHPTLLGTLLVDPDNPSALRLYDELGFRHWGEIFAFGMLYNRMELILPYDMRAALFDLDGVVIDTETQYSLFWEQVFDEYFDGQREMAHTIKGQTLVQIYDQYFCGEKECLRESVKQRLDEFEQTMSYPYIPGSKNFILRLRERGIKTAIVTSSNLMKMSNVYAAHPELSTMFDAILTSEDFAASKPSPDCYLRAAARLGVPTDGCVVFEDSFNGLRSGRAAGMYVVGLATTNSSEEIAPLCDAVLNVKSN